MRRSFPQLGKARVRKLFVEAAKRKHPCLSTSARNALLLRSDDDGGRERKRIALHLLSSLRRTAKTCEVTNATEAAVIFADDESRQFEQDRWSAPSQYQSTQEMAAFAMRRAPRVTRTCV